MSIKEFDLLPRRIFLDSSTLQTLQDYGEYIYDNVEVEKKKRIWSIPDGIDNLEALRKIIFINQRGAFEFALSENSLSEVKAKKDVYYLKWAFEVLDYWMHCLGDYNELPNNTQLALKLDSNSFGYLSKGDYLLIKDAILLGCDAFLTMEKRLPKNSPHIERELGIKILTPLKFWYLLQPWATLF